MVSTHSNKYYRCKHELQRHIITELGTGRTVRLCETCRIFLVNGVVTDNVVRIFNGKSYDVFSHLKYAHSELSSTRIVFPKEV
jgi:hypothetical protein